MRRHPSRWHPSKNESKGRVQQRRHTMIVQQESLNLARNNPEFQGIPCSKLRLMNHSRRNKSRSFSCQSRHQRQSFQRNLAKEIDLDLNEDREETWPRSSRGLVRTTRMQQMISYSYYTAHQRERIGQASQAPSLCHMPIGVCVQLEDASTSRQMTS